MATKWKNISRNCIVWIAVAVILVSTYMGIQAGYEFYEKGIENTSSYRSYSMEDYFKNRTFEESDAYQYYCRTILVHYLETYATTDSWDVEATGNFTGQDLKELNVDLDGVVSYNDSQKKKKTEITVGDTIKDTDKLKDTVVYFSGNVYVYISENDDVSNDWNIQGELQRVKDGEFFPYNEEVYLELSDYSKKVEDVSTVKLWMRISDENYASLKADWTSWMNQCKTFVTNMEIVLAAILFSVIVIIIAAFPKDTNAFGAKFDRIWLEATILLGIIFFGLSAGCATAYVQLVYEQVSEQFVHMAMAGILFFELLTIYCCISIVRKIKMRYFLKSSVCYKAIKKVFVTIRAQKEEWSYWKNKQQSTLSFKEKEMKRKRISLIITLISGIICIFVLCVLGLEWPGVMILALIAAIFMIRFYQKLWKDYQKDIQDLLDLEKILQQIYEISNGNLHAQTDINGQSLYYKATTDLASIGQGMAKSVEEQLKGERMKIDLITNVSHDLKTPLTSIISYIDLLSKDETLSDEARDYVSILERKSERLKNIVIDLFDLAKSTSGNAEVDFSILDMRKLVDQTLIEMEDKVQESGFEIITDYEAEHAQFEGDANRMYRVVQNVLENALKYSLKGSRIYIKVSDLGDLWQLSIKNTASYRMKFTEEEILERFSRGDKSRTTEGSGLGLSIAENFTKLCGGEFHIKIDGDQFVVEIRFGKKFAFIEEV